MKIKKGLLMEGGAMRGMFTAGIIDVLLENGIEFDGAIGVSAGAVFGCNYKSRQIGRTIRYNKRFCNDKRYCSLWSLITTGNLYNAEFDYHQLPAVEDPFDNETFTRNPMSFYLVATDIVSGEAKYKQIVTADYNELEWMRASASIPALARPVEVDGLKLLDGGIADSLPIRKWLEMGYGKNVIILTRPKDYIKKKMPFIWLMNLMWGRKFPGLISDVKVRHERYNNSRELIWQMEKEGSAFVFCPETDLGIGASEKNPEELERVYQIGRKIACDRLRQLKEFMAEKA